MMTGEKDISLASEEYRLSWLYHKEHYLGNPLKWTLWLLGLFVIWLFNGRHFPSGVILGSLLYALTNLFFTVVFWSSRPARLGDLSDPGSAGPGGDLFLDGGVGSSGVAGDGDLWNIIKRASIILSYGADYAYASYLRAGWPARAICSMACWPSRQRSTIPTFRPSCTCPSCRDSFTWQRCISA